MTLPGEPIRAAVLCLLLVGSAALAQPPEETKPDSPGDTFADLIPDFANTTSLEEMQAVVAKGIGSDDPQTVESTLGQISVLAMMGTVEDFHDDIPDDFAEPHQRFDPLRRQFGAVPGLRERLIEFVRDVAEEARPPIEPEVEFASVSEIERRKALTRGLAAIALAVYFPEDPVVHDFLIDWRNRDDDGYSFAVLLYSGRFRSKAADEIRIASLRTGHTADAVAAAKGLALSGSDAALAALVANLDRRDFALLTIVEAIATYGIRAKPHLDSLLELREELETHVADEDDLLALDSWRKQSIAETITELATQFENAARD